MYSGAPFDWAIYIYIYIYVCVCVCEHVYIVTATFFVDEEHLDFLRILMGPLVTPQAKYIFANPISSVTNELPVFSIVFVLVHSRITCQTYSRPTCFITELTRVTCRLLLEDFCRTRLR